MKRYVVRETLTVLFYVEAENEIAAIEKAKEKGPLDCDETDTSPRGASHFEASEQRDV